MWTVGQSRINFLRCARSGTRHWCCEDEHVPPVPPRSCSEPRKGRVVMAQRCECWGRAKHGSPLEYKRTAYPDRGWRERLPKVSIKSKRWCSLNGLEGSASLQGTHFLADNAQSADSSDVHWRPELWSSYTVGDPAAVSCPVREHNREHALRRGIWHYLAHWHAFTTLPHPISRNFLDDTQILKSENHIHKDYSPQHFVITKDWGRKRSTAGTFYKLLYNHTSESFAAPNCNAG